VLFPLLNSFSLTEQNSYYQLLLLVKMVRKNISEFHHV